MLFKIVFVCMIAYICATPLFYAVAVKFGMRLMDKPEQAIEAPIFHLPERKEAPKMTPEESRTAQILANIDRYDGTSNGQKEIVNG